MKKSPPPSTLDKKTASAALATDLANIMRKVKAGTPLTARQRDLVASVAQEQPQEQPDDAPGEDRSKPPRSASELARRLGVSRQRISAWQTRPDAPDVADVAAWRRYLGEFARVRLAPDTEAKPAPSGEANPMPRLWFADGVYSAIGRFGETLPARLAALASQAGLAPRQEQLDAMTLGLFLEHVAGMNAVLRSWSFEPFEPDDYPEQITAIIERLA
jgi:transcriptional regulator with XRE-family HTH domain